MLIAGIFLCLSALSMLRNYLKIAFRNLRRSPGYTVLNILGLALGMACCLLIALWVQDEIAFDRFHTKSDRIYRFNKVHTLPTGAQEIHALSSGPMAPTLEADFPEIEEAVRIFPWWGKILLGHEGERIPVPDVTFADANLFDVFDFHLLQGDPSTALEAPLSIILTESLARTLFEDADPLGQYILGQGDLSYRVTGIVEDAPPHSHLRYQAFVSWSSVVPGNNALELDWLDRWLPQTLFTYVLLQPDADPAALEAKFPAFMQQHFSERSDQYQFYLQPLTSIYLGSSDVLYQRSMVQGNQSYVYVLSVVALLILLIACVNFVNLSTARAGRRAVEVGVRKTVGARRRQLIIQFLGEAFLLVFIGLGLALVFTETALPYINHLADKQLMRFAWAEPSVLAVLAGLGMAIGLGAGCYPSLVLSGFRPAQVLKGQSAVGGHVFRQILVTAQFAASIALLTGTYIVYQQMQFVQSANPGYDRDKIIVLPIGPTDIGNQFDAFKKEVLLHPNVTHAAGSNSVPGEDFSTFSIQPEGRADDEDLTAAALHLHDEDLLDAYGMELNTGRFFEVGRPADSSAIVINESMMRSLGWREAVGKRFDVPGDVDNGTIIGVVKDFQTASMHQEIAPLFMILKPRPGNLSVRITGTDLPATLNHLRATWEQFETRYPFEYRFLDDAFALLYQTDLRLLQTLGIFATLAILVACLGLFGLSAYTAEQRTKEIGVRKVLGASVPALVGLLSKDFARLVCIGFVVAAPLAYVAATRWLDAFAYRIGISWWIFLLVGLIALCIALITVCYHAVHAALADPVKSLRYE